MKTSRFITLVYNSVILALLAVACAPLNTPQPVESTPTNFSMATVTHPPVVVSPSLTPSATLESTITPEPATATLEKSYNCPANPDLTQPGVEEGMTALTLKDFQNGDLAKWTMNQPQAQPNFQISKDPSRLNYKVEHINSANVNVLGTERVDLPGWATKDSEIVGVCKINPAEIGVPNKNFAFIIIAVGQDKNNKRAPKFILTGEERIKNIHDAGYFTQKNVFFDQIDGSSSYDDPSFILKGAKPGSPDDLRPLENEQNLFNEENATFVDANGKTWTGLDAVHMANQEIAETDTFSDRVIQFLSTTFQYGGPGLDLKFSSTK